MTKDRKTIVRALLVAGLFLTGGATSAQAQITGPITCNSAAEGKIIYNDGQNVVQFCDGTNWIAMGGSLSDIWEKSGSDAYYNAGNVGIGTTSPAYRLDVNGSIHANSDLYMGGTDFRI